MSITKGNKGNNYLNLILSKLGSDYSSEDCDVISSNTYNFKILHKNCNRIFEISWKKTLEGSKCPYCFCHGKNISNEYFSEYVKGKYENKFNFKSSEIKGNHRFLLLEHISCGTKFWISLTSFNKREPKCPHCSRLNTESFKELIFKKYGEEYTVLGEYINLNTPVSVRHNVCGSVINTLRPNNLLNMNQGCKKCSMKKIGVDMKKKVAPKFYKELTEKFGNRFELYDEYNGYWGKITGYDNLLDRTFCKKPSDILKMSSTPRRSIGEVRINKWLTKYNIDFNEQYMFDDLVDKRKLKFDFFIPAINTLIEFDGEQHFKNRRDDPDGSKLKITQEHDIMKNNYCKEHCIRLLRIPYTEFKNIERILYKEFKELLCTQGS